ncbi:hypothetical protein Cgig2_012405 [Carnegiea gigantea]|uniref:Uncharacterized protein n=1 Tax=Carnegiea gigantea TaxID=171969 RepID=A0A9Q1GIR0_9CARY|nr:hypothetical protein Cgig2_012405 [Carnegiea gigantea]
MTHPNEATSQSLDEPWCVLRDFNVVLHQGERIRGIKATDGEINDFAECIQQSGLQEFSYEGAFFTWTNKTIWSRIDKALHKELWYEAFAYTHVHYITHGLSDHTLITISFPHFPRPRNIFQFYDMWIEYKGFKDMVKHSLAQTQNSSSLKALQQVLSSLRQPLKELSKSRYADIYAQQARVRNDLLQIGYGDECSRIFMARMKQRKAMTSFFHIRDQNDQRVEGFDTVSEMPRKSRRLIHAVANAVTYHISLARNRTPFKNKVYLAQEILKEIKGYITHKAL